MTISANKTHLAVSLFALLLSVEASAASICKQAFWSFDEQQVRLSAERETVLTSVDAKVWSWADRTKTKLKPLPLEIIENLQHERIASVVLGGSSVHALLPEFQSSAKFYFDKGGPANLHALTNVLVDAALPLLNHLLKNQKDDRPIVLFIPSPGQVRADGQAITLPGNFGKLGGQTYALSQWVHSELLRRARSLGAPGLAKVKVFVKNDSFPLSARIGSNPAPGLRSQAKLVFAGTGLGESNIVRGARGVFKDLPTEMGHVKLSDYPGLAELLPRDFAKAAESLRVEQRRETTEFENLVAGGRAGNHLSGLLTHYYRAQEKTSTHPADVRLGEKVSRDGWLMLEDVDQAARNGGPLAQKMMAETLEAQAMLVGVMATEIGENPAGQNLTASFALGGIETGKIERDVYVRADGALLSWSRDLGLVRKSFDQGVRYQFTSNPLYIAKLRSSQVDPAWLKPTSFALKYGSDKPPVADADLECLENLTRENFVR
jgi:hypothetical protein